MGLHETKELLNNKRNDHQIEDATQRFLKGKHPNGQKNT
jgi:hypothetical protein